MRDDRLSIEPSFKSDVHPPRYKRKNPASAGLFQVAGERFVPISDLSVPIDRVVPWP